MFFAYQNSSSWNATADLIKRINLKHDRKEKSLILTLRVDYTNLSHHVIHASVALDNDSSDRSQRACFNYCNLEIKSKNIIPTHLEYFLKC